MPGSSVGPCASRSRTAAAPWASSGTALDNPPAPTSCIDRIGFLLAERPAAIDDLLRTPLHLGVVALHGSEVEILGIRAARDWRPPHRPVRFACRARRVRSCARPAELPLLDLARIDVAESTGNHDRLVVPASLRASWRSSSNVRKYPQRFGRPNSLLNAARTDRTFQHDLQRRGHAPRLAVVAASHGCANPGIRRCETVKPVSPAFGFAAASGRAFVADLSARARCRARERRDGRRMVVRFHLHQDVDQLAVIAVGAAGDPESSRRRDLPSITAALSE